MFTFLLTKLPWIGTAFSFLGSKKRLILEYAMIALVVTIAGFTFSLWIKKKDTELELAHAQTDLVNIQARLNVVESINDSQEVRINDLKQMRLRDAQALTGLLTDYKFLAERDITVRKRLTTLERSNEVVRDYLNEPMPPALSCMLNRTCASGD